MMKQKPQLSKSCSHFEKLAALSWDLGDCLLSDRASLKLMNIDSQIRLQLVRNMGAVGQNLRSGETTHEIEIQPSNQHVEVCTTLSNVLF